MPRALVPAFVLYSAVAVLAAYGARVVATRAERTAVQSPDALVIERLPEAPPERADSATTPTAASRPVAAAVRRREGESGSPRGADGGPGGSER